MAEPSAPYAAPPYRLKLDPTVIGSTGLRQFGGFVNEEYLKELQGLRGVRTYREMADNDATVGAVLFAITMLIRQATWHVQEADETPEAEAGKEFLKEVLDDLCRPWGDIVAEICTMFTYGFAPMELVWKRRGGPAAQDKESRSKFSDGKIGLRNLALRAQQTVIRWQFDTEDGEILGMWQQPWAGAMVFVPTPKLVVFRTQAISGNPEGRSILRNAYRAYYFKKRIEEIEGVGIERDLAGLPVATIPAQYMSPEADPLDKAVYSQWKTMVQNVRRDAQEGIIIPSDRDSSGNPLFDFKLLSTGGSRTFDTTKVVDRWNRAIAMSVLADFIFLGQQAVGSFALSSDKTALFATAIGGFLGSIADTMNRCVVDALWELNGLPDEAKPRLVPGDLEKPNLVELAGFIQTLAGAGATMFPDRDLENHLREAAGLPPAPEDPASGDGGADEVPPPKPGVPGENDDDQADA